MQLFEFDVTQAFLSIQMEQLEKNIIAITVPDGKVFFLGTQRIAIMVQDKLFHEENYSPTSVHRRNNVFISGAFDALKQIYSIKEEKPLSGLGDFIEYLIETNIIAHNTEFNNPPHQDPPPVQNENDNPPHQDPPQMEKQFGAHHPPLPPGFNRDLNLPIPPIPPADENSNGKKSEKKSAAKKAVKKAAKKSAKKVAAKKSAKKSGA